MVFNMGTNNLQSPVLKDIDRKACGGRTAVRPSVVLWTLLPALICCSGFPTASAQEKTGAIPATGCFLRLKDQAQVPALEQGVLKKIHVELGVQVSKSQLLVTLDDTAAQLTLQLAEIDLAIAMKQESESVAIQIAEAQVDESVQLVEQAKIDLSVAKTMAESEIAVRQARAANTLASEEFERAMKSRKEFATSVSELELAKLRYALEKSVLDIEQARYDQNLQSLRSNSRSAFVAQQEVAARRLGFELQDARSGQEISTLTVERMKKSVEVAREKLARRQLKSPLTGMVVEKLRDEGEWVEAGEPVLRVIRIDRLLVEGYVDADLIDESDRGRAVVVRGDSRRGLVTVEGRIIFVSPEVDSVNRQVQVKAEIDNTNLALRPGQPVEMVIQPEDP